MVIRNFICFYIFQKAFITLIVAFESLFQGVI